MNSKFVCIRQTTTADCGAACLATIAQTYGIGYGLESLRQRIPVDATGATLLAVVEATRQCGFEAQAILTDLSMLPHLPLPCIAHLQGQVTNHYVVIHQCEGGILLVADPAQGLIRYRMEDFVRLWSGALIVLTLQDCALVTPSEYGVTLSV
jgi:ATP-binding cassette, subfamily C, bacteriocin exporter